LCARRGESFKFASAWVWPAHLPSAKRSIVERGSGQTKPVLDPGRGRHLLETQKSEPVYTASSSAAASCPGERASDRLSDVTAACGANNSAHVCRISSSIWSPQPREGARVRPRLVRTYVGRGWNCQGYQKKENTILLFQLRCNCSG
jgi:hypothetical protein